MAASDIELEYLDITQRNAWSLIFQKIARESQCHLHPCKEARKLTNKPLNRYRDVNPYDHSRVVLRRCENDYINANLLRIPKAKRSYILTQGPLPLTVGHFWLMVWEQDSRAIIMLNKVIEKLEIKCHWYWPLGVGEEHRMVLNDEGLTVEQISEEDSGYYVTRVFRISDTETEEGREVLQYHYTTWPDFGVPSSPDAFLRFLTRVRDAGVLEPGVGPAVVHCSAGIGRSGTFCLVDSCLVLVKEGATNIDIQSMLKEMRQDRMGLIQTPDQLRFSYEAIVEGTKRLQPGWEQSQLDESIYSTVAEAEDEAPPPPPPRGESLARPPARPLPAIPSSTSMGNFNYPQAKAESSSGSGSSDEGAPTPPPRRSPSPASSADDEDEEQLISTKDSVGGGCAGDAEVTESVRRRRTRTRELTDRVSAMKRRARDAERWHALKRSLYKPLTITFGFLIAGIVIYTYVKH